MEEGAMIGFNSPENWTVFSESALLPCGNGIVTQTNESCSFWVPNEGFYGIDKIACHTESNLLCLTESRLALVLHLYEFNSKRKLDEIDIGFSSEVHAMVFTEDGSGIFLLCCVPEPSIVFVRTLNMQLRKEFSFNLPIHQFSSLLLAGDASSHICNIIVTHSSGIVGYMSGKNGFTCTVDAECGDLSCCSCSSSELLVGCAGGEIKRYDFGLYSFVSWGHAPGERLLCLCHAPSGVLASTQSGKILQFTSEGSFTSVLIYSSPIPKMIMLPANRFLFSSAAGLYIMDLNDELSDPSLLRGRPSTVVNCFPLSDNTFALFSVDGAILQCDLQKNTVSISGNHSASRGKVIGCCQTKGQIFVAYNSGIIVCLDALDLSECYCHQKKSFFPSVCAANDSIAVFADDSFIYLIRDASDEPNFMGPIHVSSINPISLLRWASEESLLVSTKGGDVFLVRMPADEYDVECVECTWRLDFPIYDLFVCYFEGNIINILAHSHDRETKLYALDKRASQDAKVLRPYFLIKDHEKGGNYFYPHTTGVLSCGKDGRLVLRDITSYKTRLPPIPPSRERRAPIYSAMIRQRTCGGISSLCRVGSFLVVIGNDSTVAIIPENGSDIRRLDWAEPHWQGSLKVRASESIEEMSIHAAGDATALRAKLEELKGQMDLLLAKTDVEVPIEHFLLQNDKDSFRDECDTVRHEAHENQHYDLLKFRYLQDHVKKQYWDRMAIQRCTVTGIKDPKMVVHNFHVPKTPPSRDKIFTKVKFLLRVREAASFPGSNQSALINTKDCTFHPLCDEFLLPPLDVYTRVRSTMQLISLVQFVAAKKRSFNDLFTNLKEKKKKATAKIEEGNKRCAYIAKLLGDMPGTLYHSTGFIDPDPASVFKVTDEEMAAALPGYVGEKGSQFFITSPADEAALKLWMDGLEERTEQLAVQVKLPTFADESLESFVPPDERTEEQVRAMEEYEKILKEQVTLLNERRDSLRSEFESLQKQNMDTAAKVDEDLRELLLKKIKYAKDIAALELLQVKIFETLLHVHDAFTGKPFEVSDVSDIERKKLSASYHLQQWNYNVQLESQRCEEVSNQFDSFVSSIQKIPLFTDPVYGDKFKRRFNRWRRKGFEDDTRDDDEQATILQQNASESWDAFMELKKDILARKQIVEEAKVNLEAVKMKMRETEEEVRRYQDMLDSDKSMKAKRRERIISDIRNVTVPYLLNQGQVQDESALQSSDYDICSLLPAIDIGRLNEWIVTSDSENIRLLERIHNRRQGMKLIEWEIEESQFRSRTLEIELKQLHTLRVTRQMQEWLNGDYHDTEQKQIDRISNHMTLVDKDMADKAKRLKETKRRLKNQLSERLAENNVVSDYCKNLRSVVEDRQAIKTLTEHRSDDTQCARQRMQDIFETSELEELARSQQEELIALKNEVDRLRERTFPSFAVVSKQTRV